MPSVILPFFCQSGTKSHTCLNCKIYRHTKLWKIGGSEETFIELLNHLDTDIQKHVCYNSFFSLIFLQKASDKTERCFTPRKVYLNV